MLTTLYSFPGQGEGEASETALMVESPPLQRVKAISETSEASDTGSFTSQGWEDTGEAGQRGPGGGEGTTMFWFPVLLDIVVPFEI